jgi:hypothetical protein
MIWTSMSTALVATTSGTYSGFASAYPGADVVPDERFEADAGPDPDVDPVRQSLATLLEGLVECFHVVDPLLSAEAAKGSVERPCRGGRRADPRLAALPGRTGQRGVVVVVQLPVVLG